MAAEMAAESKSMFLANVRARRAPRMRLCCCWSVPVCAVLLAVSCGPTATSLLDSLLSRRCHMRSARLSTE